MAEAPTNTPDQNRDNNNINGDSNTSDTHQFQFESKYMTTDHQELSSRAVGDKGNKYGKKNNHNLARTVALASLHPYTAKEIVSAVLGVFGDLKQDEFPAEHRVHAVELLCAYKYEWLPPRLDGIYVARSYEIPGCIGQGASQVAALKSSVRSHIATFRTMIDRELLPLPHPLSGRGIYQKPIRSKNVSIRMTEDEFAKLKELADLRSVSLSEIIRDTINFMTSTPTENVPVRD